MASETWAVIPAYNEAGRISTVIKNTKRYVDQVLVVDDCSSDETCSEASDAFVIRNPVNMGAGFSTRVGCDIAHRLGADYIVTIDADGQHDPHEIPKLKGHLVKNDLDIVFGSRPQDRNMPLIKRIGNIGLSTIASVLFNVRIKDSQTGYHLFTNAAYPRLRWVSNRYGVVSEFVMRVGRAQLRYDEVKVKTIYVDKNVGMSKVDAVKSVLSMLKWRFKG